jgi:transcriptional regulator with GAF, ATPase, and Fis domain
MAVSYAVIAILVVSVAIALISLSLSPNPYKRSLPSGVLILALGLLLAAAANFSNVMYGTTGSETTSPEHAQAISGAETYWMLSSVAFLVIAGGMLIGAVQRRRLHDNARISEEELQALRGSGHQVDQRFQYLFNNTTDAVYCYEFDPPLAIDLPLDEQVRRSHDAVLATCNAVFARTLGAERVEDVIGSRFGALDSSKNTALHTAYFTAFIKNGYTLSDREIDFVDSGGQRWVLSINLVGVLRDGFLERIWSIDADILDLKRTKEALATRHLFQSLVGKISAQMVKASDAKADEVIESCLKSVCRFVAADRAAIFWLDNGKDTYSVSHLWSRVGNPYSKEMSTAALPAIFEKLKAMQAIRVDDVNDLPEQFAVDKESFEVTNTRAFVVMPLIVEGELAGGFTVGRVLKAAAWSDQDESDLRVLSEIFGNFVGQLFSRRALDGALDGLRHATDRLEAENVYLREEIEVNHGFDEIVGRSNAIMRSLKLVEQVAKTRTAVLLLGETGTGKELAARAIHELSDRRTHSLVKVNCAALPATLIESELFGHEKGAFTGAERSKRGRFDLADGSTLFLDEIGEIPVELQSKLLRVLQEGEFERVGGTKTIRVDVRIIAATNLDIHAAVRDGEFRSDLFYRISTFPIELPALRDRDGDVQLLARHFVNIHAQQLGRNVTEISSNMMRQLEAYHWPGNIRELDGIIQRALISSRGPILDLAEPLSALDQDDTSPRVISSSLVELKHVERSHIVSVLTESRWKISGEKGAAAQLGMPASTLRSKMKKLGIERPN